MKKKGLTKPKIHHGNLGILKEVGVNAMKKHLKGAHSVKTYTHGVIVVSTVKPYEFRE